MIRRDADQNRGITLFIFVARRLVDLPIERRDSNDRRRFTTNRIGVCQGQFFAMDLFRGWLMTDARIKFGRPDRVRPQRFDLCRESLVQSLDDRHHEDNRDDADADSENRQRRAQLVRAHGIDGHPS